MNEQTAVEQLIKEREKTVGDFTEQSQLIELTLETWIKTRNWNRLYPFQKQALRMLLHKIGRILVGDPMYLEHWVDGEGYIHLVVQRLQQPRRVLEEPDYPGTPEDGGQHSRAS